LERLTQVTADGEFIETAISGFVSGEDGKYGVRGTVVDKSSKLVSNAALSGLFSGVNQYFQSVARSKYCDDCCDYRSGWKDCGYGALQEGAFCGSSDAFNALTDYYIKRAEQIRPV